MGADLTAEEKKKEGAKVATLTTPDVACTVGTATTLLGGVNRLTLAMT